MSLDFIYFTFSSDILYILYWGRYFNRQPSRRLISARHAFELFLAKYLLECSCEIHSRTNLIVDVVITVILHEIRCDHFIHCRNWRAWCFLKAFLRYSWTRKQPSFLYTGRGINRGEKTMATRFSWIIKRTKCSRERRVSLSWSTYRFSERGCNVFSFFWKICSPQIFIFRSRFFLVAQAAFRQLHFLCEIDRIEPTWKGIDTIISLSLFLSFFL